jgi:hypothetical protein
MKKINTQEMIISGMSMCKFYGMYNNLFRCSCASYFLTHAGTDCSYNDS